MLTNLASEQKKPKQQEGPKKQDNPRAPKKRKASKSEERKLGSLPGLDRVQTQLENRASAQDPKDQLAIG
jgi:hypothetical protein